MSTAAIISAELEASLVAGKSVAEPLDLLLTALQARAVGLWRVRGDALEQLGFRAVADMPTTVREEFAVATRHVPLSASSLGIVKAATTAQPAIARVEDRQGLNASAGWLARFGACQSVACPILRGKQVWGVLASSSSRPMQPGDSEWSLLTNVAEALGAPRDASP